MIIYKYLLLETTDIQHIEMPQGAILLHVDNQAERIYLWALVDRERPSELRTIRIVGTGHEVEIEDTHHPKHIGSLLMLDGRFVWHVFEMLK